MRGNPSSSLREFSQLLLQCIGVQLYRAAMRAIQWPACIRSEAHQDYFLDGMETRFFAVSGFGAGNFE